MSRTFSYRRKEIVEKSPSIANIQERWPALFDTSQVKEEFRRLTAVELETTFMANLDKHTDALLSLFRTKGGKAGQQIREILIMLNQVGVGQARLHPPLETGYHLEERVKEPNSRQRIKE
ncbi:unnamed protein product [Leuciscus chuanchicus]